MKFIVSSKALKDRLTPLLKVINPTTVLPILADFLFQVEKSKLTVSATDLENYMTVTLDIEAKEKGMFTLPAKQLMGMLRVLEDQPIVFSYDAIERRCTVSGDSFKTSFPTEDWKNYPKCATAGDSVKMGTVEAVEWITQLRKAIAFVSTDDLRPAMTGVYIHDRANGKPVQIAATDAHRLYWNDLKTVKQLEGIKAILPAKAVRTLLFAMPKPQAEDVVDITADGKHVFFYFGGYSLITRAIDAKFPDYRVVIPLPDFEFSLIRKDAIRFLKLVRQFTNSSTLQTKLVIDSKEKSLSLEGADVDFEFSATAHMNAYNFNKECNITIAFNANFLLQILQLDTDHYVRIQHCGQNAKAVVVDNHILLMPLMLNE